MLQLLRLLLYLAAGAVFYVPGTQSIYYESAPSCGYSVTEFVHFEKSPELENEPTLGVCGVGFDNLDALQPRIKSCLSCTFTPADQPACDTDATLVLEPPWYLALRKDCQWQGCLYESACSNGTVASTTLCDDGTLRRECCPFKRYNRCCTSLNCIARSSPAGQCIDGEKDLLPGQQFLSQLFAVSAASTDCSNYSFKSTRVCQADRTFAPFAYESCSYKTVSRDSEGCVKVPGYTFHQGRRVSDSDNWRIDDGTPWSELNDTAAAQQVASRDMLLMATRCSALATCAGFQNTGASTDLLYQLPTSSQWLDVEPSVGTHCYGIYEKTPQQSYCPRISGYIFIPQRTLDTSATGGFTPSGDLSPCRTCSNSSALASSCDVNSTCAGFSNYHGLFTHSENNTSILSDAATSQFTLTPCVGMFVRTHGVFPLEVEQLDRLLCGELVYCPSSQLRYHAVSDNYFVNLTVDIYTDLAVPRGLQDASGGSLRQLPAVRSLTFRCHNGSMMLGGLPVGLSALMPFLQELRVQGCRADGGLPEELTQLRYLRVLDLSENSLTGPLPAAWGNLALSYLNLSYNALTGTVPVSWRGVITSPGSGAPALPSTAGRRRVAQATSPASAGTQMQLRKRVADLSANRLNGPVDRGFVYDTCVRNKLHMLLHGDASSMLSSGSNVAVLMLQYNPGVAAWSGQYAVADLGMGSSSDNLCGAYGYKIALGVLWGVFGVCLVGICSWSAILGWKAARAARRGRFFIADMGGPVAGDSPAAADGRGVMDSGCAASTRGLAAHIADSMSELWSKRWVRRVTLLARVGYLAADVALDIRVTVWLFNDGDTTSAAVCLGFMVATQALVSAALVVSLSHHFFSSRLLIAFLSPLLLAMGPVVGPVLALANIRNSDMPLVFWRYLELVEFCVALLQAPAEAVTQSVVYARLNRLGNGMYMDHSLFVASIIFSLGDMLIAAVKLCRYKRGPLRRMLVAFTYLDRVRDPVDYQKPLLSGSMDYGTGVYGTGDSNYMSHYLDTPLNPPADANGRTTARPSQLPRTEAGPLPLSPPADGGGEDANATPILETSPREERHPADEAPAAVATAHTFTPLTAPRYRPSLLAASSQRLGGGAHAMGAPSRLGPGGTVRSGSLAVSTQPPLRTAVAHLPVTPTATARMVVGTSEASSSSAQARAWSAAEAEAALLEESKSGSAGSGNFSRRSHGLQQSGLPAQFINVAAGSTSLDVYGSAATGGHGPPNQGDAALAAEAQGTARLAASSAAVDPSAGPSSAAAAAVAAEAVLPLPSPPAGQHYLPSAAAAAKAALEDSNRPLGSKPALLSAASATQGPSGPTSSGPAERLVLGPPLRSSSVSAQGDAGPSPNAKSLQHVSSLASSSRSAQGSPARRREGPVLSIAVPASPVQAQGIEVIRMSTPSSAGHLSPQTSRGAPTPVAMLLPPPQQHVRMQLQRQRERLETQQQQRQDNRQVQQGPSGSAPQPPPNEFPRS